MDHIVKDSSVWRSSNSESLADNVDAAIRVGTIRERKFVEELDDYRYIVEVWDNNSRIPIQCVLNTRFGGLYNYEEFTSRGYTTSNDSENVNTGAAKPGDHVLVAYAYGDPKEGLIISQLKHPSRKCKIDPKSGDIAYTSEFNGWNKTIMKDGSVKVIQKLLPTNIAKLDEPPEGSKLPEPEYANENAKYATSYEFTVEGSYILSDNTMEDPQKFAINKPEGTMEIISGKTSMVIDKEKESYTVENKLYDITTKDEFKVTTGGTMFKTSKSAYELEAGEIKTKGKWDQTGNMKITGNVDVSTNVTIGASLTSQGITKLAGGANALIYDIVIIKGTGNAGAPVISNATVLKTVLTKAT